MLAHVQPLLVAEKLTRFRGIWLERTRRAMAQLANHDGARHGRNRERYQIIWRCQKVNLLKSFGDYFYEISHSFRDLNAPIDPSRTRRKSIYNFFLRHQDAVDDHMTSPSVHKRQVKPKEDSPAKPSETVFAKTSETPTSPPQKTSKRATSFIKKKPRLERGLSDQSVLRLNRNVHLGWFVSNLWRICL